mgnify:CR=1 FL=1
MLAEDAGGEDGDGVHVSARAGANSSVIALLAATGSREQGMTELYHAVSVEFRRRKGWSVSHLPADDEGPPPGGGGGGGGKGGTGY